MAEKGNPLGAFSFSHDIINCVVIMSFVHEVCVGTD